MDAHWQLVSVYDGDSFHVNGAFSAEILIGLPGYDGQSVGVITRRQEMVRVVRCNAAELDDPSDVVRAMARSARDAVRQWFTDHTYPEDVQLDLAGRDKYKRLLADVVGVDGTRLSAFVLGLPGTTSMKLLDQIREK